jgi:hypothetical protein
MAAIGSTGKVLVWPQLEVLGKYWSLLVANRDRKLEELSATGLGTFLAESLEVFTLYL